MPEESLEKVEDGDESEADVEEESQNTGEPSSAVGMTDQLLDPLRGKAESEADLSTGNKFLKQIQEKIENVVDSGEVSSIEEPLQGNLIMPYNQEVINEAIEVMKMKKQEFYAEEFGLTDEEKIQRLKVQDLDEEFNDIIHNHNKILFEFGIHLSRFHDDIIDEIEERTEQDIQNPLKNVDSPVMGRKIALRLGPDKDISILYGTRKIIYNICDDLGYSSDKINFVRLCHNIAAKKNNLHLYTLVEDVLFIKSTLHEEITVTDEEIRELEDGEEPDLPSSSDNTDESMSAEDLVDPTEDL
jgi:hypothetical protein